MCDAPHQDREFTARDHRLLAAVFAAALLGRLVYLIAYSRSPYWDALIMDPGNHWELASGIAGGRGLGPYAYFRAPLYLYLLAGVVRVFGDGLWPIRIFQALIGSATAALTFRLARFYLRRPAALLAGMLQALYWLNVYFDGELLTENLATFLGLAGLVLLVRADRPGPGPEGPSRQTLAYWGAGGLALGLAAITRPNILPFAALAGLVLAGRAARAPGTRLRALVPAAVFGLGVVVCVIPVAVRNLIVADDLVLIASQGGINFWIGNHASADGRTVVVPVPRREIPLWFLESRRDHPWFKEDVWLSSAYGAETALRRRVRESEISDYWYGQAWSEIRAGPGRSAGLLLKKTLYLVQAREVGNNRDLYYHRDDFPVLRVLAVVSLVWISPLTLTGLVLALLRRREWKWPLLFYGCYAATVAAFFVTSRYRAPLLPVGMVLAGLTVETAVSAGRGRAGSFPISLAKTRALLVVALVVSGGAVNLPWPAWNDVPLRSAMHYNLGIALAHQERWPGAERELRAALALKDSYPEAHFWLGKALAGAGRTAEAAAAYETCAAQDPAYAPAYFELYLAYRALALAAADPARRDELGLRAWSALARAHRLAPNTYPAPPPRPAGPGPGE